LEDNECNRIKQDFQFQVCRFALQCVKKTISHKIGHFLGSNLLFSKCSVTDGSEESEEEIVCVSPVEAAGNRR